VAALLQSSCFTQSLLNINDQVKAAAGSAEHSVVTSPKPSIHVWPGVDLIAAAAASQPFSAEIQ
jgi:hypothetical protein